MLLSSCCMFLTCHEEFLFMTGLLNLTIFLT